MKNHGSESRKGAEPCGRWCLGKKDQLILLYPSIVIISSSKGQRRKKHKFEMLYIQCSFKAFFTEVSNTKMSLMTPLQPTSRGWLSVMNTPLEVGFDGAIWSWRHSCRASPCWETNQNRNWGRSRSKKRSPTAGIALKDKHDKRGLQVFLSLSLIVFLVVTTLVCVFSQRNAFTWKPVYSF